MRQLIVTLFGAAAMGVACAPGALAADMPVKAPIYTKAPAIVADPWTGFYLGVSAGGRWNKDTWTTTDLGFPFFFTGRDNPHDFTKTSARFGLYGGYNWRIYQTWVVGLEADFAWASNKTSSAGIPSVLGAIPQDDSVQMKDTWDGGVRGRVGYLVTPTVLLFGTGGRSWMRSQASITCGGNPFGWCTGDNFTSGRTDSVSKTVAGWTVGGGLEAVVAPNWLLRGEYRYTRYAGYHANLLQDGAAGIPTFDSVNADIGNIRTQTVLIGLAYKFGQ